MIDLKKARARFGLAVFILGVASLLGPPVFGRNAVASDLAPAGLKCEYRIDPLGIDALKPRLSWILESRRRGQVQEAYQVLVADSAESLAGDRGNLWDSGRVAARESLQIVYGGKTLRSGLRCHWKVRVWDADGNPSAWSRPGFWEMALLDPEDWRARWIEDGKPSPERD
ncbi:MAG: hypothetical protein IH583_09635, partial [Candidatus Aminicenantes bacterium]|nr:hypothetical protein [Candidatus Aminicenantes bacterium]